MSPGLFLSATTTEVGKTTIGLLICDYLNQSCIPYFPYKPVESGVENIPSDARAYHIVSKEKYAIDEICPFPLKDPVAPTLAAEREGKVITTNDILAPLQKREDFIVVEGAGGWYSPLTSDGMCSDLAKELGYPVIFVIKDELGAINQALLTARAIEVSGLFPVAAVLNFYRKDSLTANLSQLEKYLTCPVFPLSTRFKEEEVLKFFDFFSRFVYPRCAETSS